MKNDDGMDRGARISQLIEQYRAAEQTRLVKRMMRLRRAEEASLRFAKFEVLPKRIH